MHHPIAKIHLGESCNYQLVAQDPQGEAPVFSLALGPAGMSLDLASGLVTWTTESAGDYPLAFGVTAPAGNRGDQFLTLQVAAEAIRMDPADSAPPLDPASGGEFIEDIRFPFEGPEAPQIGLQPGALETGFEAVGGQICYNFRQSSTKDLIHRQK